MGKDLYNYIPAARDKENTISGDYHLLVQEKIKSFNSRGKLEIGFSEKKKFFTRDFRNHIKNNTANPEMLLGLFDQLPRSVQLSIVKAIEEDDRWKMKGAVLSDLHVNLCRRLKELSGKTKNQRLKKTLNILGILIQKAPAKIIYYLYDYSRLLKGVVLSGVDVPLFLRLLNINPSRLAVCYARGINIDRRFRGFFHDEVRNITYGTIVGIDIIPTETGDYFIESNLEGALTLSRARLYDEDPFVKNLINFAKVNNYEHLVYVYNQYSRIDKLTARRLRDECEKNRITLRIIEDIFMPESEFERDFFVPSIDKENTLVVRGRKYNISLDSIFDNKGAAMRIVEKYNELFPDEHVLVPETSTEPVIGEYSKDSPFPNVVFKLPEIDVGKGVVFLKVSSKEEANEMVTEFLRTVCKGKGFIEKLNFKRTDKKGFYQRFVCSPLLDNKYLYKVRIYILLTPAGIKYLNAARVRSSSPIPEALADGIVRDVRPYLVNVSLTGGHPEKVSPEEEERMIRASMAVGKALSWAAAYSFRHQVDRQ